MALKIKVEGLLKTGDIVGFELPAIRIVCDRCNGSGKHVNPNIDGNGISIEEFDADSEFRDNYFSGVYDVTCDKCNGRNVIEVVDEEACKQNRKDRKNLVRYIRAKQARDDHEMECRIALYWESGGNQGSRY